MMNDNERQIEEAIKEAKLLEKFRRFCDQLEDDPAYRHEILNILYRSSDKDKTLRIIFNDRMGIELEDTDDIEYLMILVNAFFNKKSQRQIIPDDVRIELLKKQGSVCAFCGCPVDVHDPVDHIIPFKYVGDELKDNYQILCPKCNSSKGKQLDYQIKILLQQ